MKSLENTHRAGIFVMLLLTSLSAIGQTQQPSATDEGAEVSKTGAISGRVIDESGQPLSNASVSIRAYGATVGPGWGATTDREGNFKVDGLERVVYLVSASVPAYTLRPRDPDSTQSNIYRVGDSVTLVLMKGGVITGNVTTSTGEPVEGVRVRAQMIRDVYGQPSRYGAPFRERTTDDRGVYRIYGLPGGTYLVLAGGGDSGSGINAYEMDVPTYAPSTGRDAASEISVRAGEETASVDIRYRGDPGHIVSGTADGPQFQDWPGFYLTLTSTADGGSQWSTPSFQASGSRRFVFYGVADGDYDVTAQSFVQGGDSTVSEPKRIRVRGTDITGLQLTTKPLGSVSGRVLLEESRAIECKGKRRPLFTETLVSAWHNEKDAAKDQPQFIWALGGPSYPNAQGDISLRNLAPGQYQFIARFFAKYWYLQSISLQPSVPSGGKSTQTNRPVDAARNWTTLKSGDRLSGLTITLAEGAGSLRGQVTLGEGEKFPARLFVYLVPIEKERAEDVLRFFASPVSPDGKITLNNLAPGRYWIVAQPAIDTAPSPLTKLRLPEETETRAKLRRDAEAAKTEIEFKPCQNMTDYQMPLNTSPMPPAKKGLMGP